MMTHTYKQYSFIYLPIRAVSYTGYVHCTGLEPTCLAMPMLPIRISRFSGAIILSIPTCLGSSMLEGEGEGAVHTSITLNIVDITSVYNMKIEDERMSLEDTPHETHVMLIFKYHYATNTH